MRDLSTLADHFRDLRKRLDQRLPQAVAMAAQVGANHAIKNHAFKSRSGVLASSIATGGVTGTFTGGDLQSTISAGAGHALFVAKGTKPHEIRPKYRKVLRWPVEGGYRFARGVKHPGTKADPFLDHGAAEAVKILRTKLVPGAVKLAMHESGLA